MRINNHIYKLITQATDRVCALIKAYNEVLSSSAYKGMARVCALVLVIALAVACANRGVGPQGGPKDETPPEMVKENPPSGSTNFKGKSIEITFNEYLQMDNVAENVLISPPQQRPPEVKAVGKKVIVTFETDLVDSTTYTIDFGSSICDLNEKNPIEGYTYSFATGDMIDTLEVAGLLLNAENLNPVSGIMVGIQRNLDDSALATIPFTRISKTNKDGEFVIKNVHEGRYRVYGLQDVSKDYIYQPGEGLAIYDSIISPTCHRELVIDTLWKDSIFTYEKDGETLKDTMDVVDTIMETEKTFFEPGELLLMFFHEDKTRQYFVRCLREQQHFFRLIFAAPADSLPQIRPIVLLPDTSAAEPVVLQPADSTKAAMRAYQKALKQAERDAKRAEKEAIQAAKDKEREAKRAAKWAAKHPVDSTLLKPVDNRVFEDVSDHWTDYAMLQANPTNDTLTMWLTDSLAIRLDTLVFEMTYMKSDSLYQLQPQVDTIKAIFRAPKLSARAQASIEKNKKIPEVEVKTNASSSFDVYKPLQVSFSTPLTQILADSLHLYLKKDTVLTPLAFDFEPVDSAHTKYQIKYQWEPQSEYVFEADSAAFVDVYGSANREYKTNFKICSLDEYSSLIIKLDPWIENARLQVLDEKDVVVRELPALPEGAKFEYLKPVSYYLRMYVDENQDGKWTTGDYMLKRRPELVYYFNTKLTLRANWDFEETWDAYKLPITEQKPKAIVKSIDK